ncbi:MAG: polysaccharide biosynthesis/export family protein [Dysgonomonas sp.]
MKLKHILLFSISLAFIFSSCGSTKKVTYFQDIDTIRFEKNPYTLVIEPGDNLYITVSTINKEAAAIFNAIDEATSNLSVETMAYKGYLVDEDGNINFPLIGKLKLSGLTKKQAIELLKTEASAYISDPVINIRFLNYKITVLGEVTKPGVYDFSDEKVSLFDALGKAGDLSIYGKRKNVIVCRDVDGKKEYTRLDLTSAQVFNSPYYYLQQNDIIYVEANSAKIVSSSIYNQNLPLILSTISTLTTVITLIITINRN